MGQISYLMLESMHCVMFQIPSTKIYQANPRLSLVNLPLNKNGIPNFAKSPNQIEHQVVFDAHFFVQRGVSAVLSSGSPVLFVGAAQQLGLVTEASLWFAVRGLQAYMAYMNDQMDIWEIYIYT